MNQQRQDGELCEEEKSIIPGLQQNLRINTAQPTPQHKETTDFLLSLETHRIEFVARKPLVLLKWQGTNPLLSSILLYFEQMNVDVVLDEGLALPLACGRIALHVSTMKDEPKMKTSVFDIAHRFFRGCYSHKPIERTSEMGECINFSFIIVCGQTLELVIFNFGHLAWEVMRLQRTDFEVMIYGIKVKIDVENLLMVTHESKLLWLFPSTSALTGLGLVQNQLGGIPLVALHIAMSLVITEWSCFPGEAAEFAGVRKQRTISKEKKFTFRISMLKLGGGQWFKQR
ncbi:hypothetical protein VNO77_26699 [Canavalia gladiata]|uniref:Uncharacterized protein n=1 Tax=Canavalia gladiata TaxID=3824 RepID=A0AAN9KTJ1_CANGL